MVPRSKEKNLIVQPNELKWNSQSQFEFRGHNFLTDMGWGGNRAPTQEALFTIVKNKQYFNAYLDFLNFPAKDVFEVGFFEGGSSVFFDLFYSPESLTCLDRRKDEIEPVNSYIARNGRTDKFRMIYDSDQGDKQLLSNLANEYHPQGLDLVIDDASHQYHLTKATFSVLFPRLKPNGIYVIEDYGWAHDIRYQENDHVWSENPSLSNLVFQLIMICAKDSALIKSVYVDRGMCIIERGNVEISDDILDIDGEVLLRGKDMTLI